LGISHTASLETYALKAGDFINAALVTALDSDIPGTVVAQVTRNVFDHASGRVLLIPQGARLVGRYDGKPIFGQTRAMILWREIVLPNGRSIHLENLLGADAAGASGVEDAVDTHISPIMRAIALSTALTVAGAAAQSADTRSNGGAILNDTASGVSTRASEVGQRFVDRDLNQAPTLRVRQGWPIAVIVDKDIELPAYSTGLEAGRDALVRDRRFD
jgi:type IV secretion system protein VirB10